jgi:DNA-binding SARP family transcriptional activator/streptogramin lyase
MAVPFDAGANEMEIRILGPLEAWVDAGRVDLGGGRQRALLALLTLHANEVVSSERLIDELWGAQPPATAQKALQNLVSQLRRTLGSTAERALVTYSPGYSLRLGDDALDAWRFERLAAEGRHLLEEEPARAAERLRSALALWRGDPLLEFAYEPFAQAEITRLHELRLEALEDRIDADLSLGRDAELVPELEALVAAFPLRERLRRQLMLALYRTGRQAEALETYRLARTVMREELGLEPGAALKRLEHAILEQDPSLGPAPKLPPPPHGPRRRRLAIAAATALFVAAAVGVSAAAVLGRDPAAPLVVPNSLLKVDPRTNEIVDVITVGETPGQPVVVGDYVFVAGEDDGTLTRVHMRSGQVTTSGRQDASGSIAGAGDEWLWVVSTRHSEVSRVEVASLGSFDRVGLPRNLDRAFIAVGGGSLWVSEYLPPAVSRWSLKTLRLERRYRLRPDAEPWEVAFGGGAAWVADGERHLLLRIDARSGRMARIRVGAGPSDPLAGFGSVWTGMFGDDSVWRIDPDDGMARAIIHVPKTPVALASGAGSIWVSSHCAGVVSRIDPDTDSVVATIETHLYPTWLAVGGGFVWVGVIGESPFNSPLSPVECEL